MGIIPAQKKYNLHQMNKEIYQAAQAHAENLYTTIERSRRSNVYTYWAYCSVSATESIKWLKTF
jgi:hypothetical protein